MPHDIFPVTFYVAHILTLAAKQQFHGIFQDEINPLLHIQKSYLDWALDSANTVKVLVLTQFHLTIYNSDFEMIVHAQ